MTRKEPEGATWVLWFGGGLLRGFLFLLGLGMLVGPFLRACESDPEPVPGTCGYYAEYTPEDNPCDRLMPSEDYQPWIEEDARG